MNFTCPYCNHHTTITSPNYFSHWEKIQIIKSDKGEVGVYVVAITCPNKDCGRLWLRLDLHTSYNQYGDWKMGESIQTWQLLPESEAKVLPDYVPKPISDDYYEACRIRDLSPKASATLSRRCLQGMIRDFWKISKPKLKEEIEELKNLIDVSTWEAIDSVRNVGNIGAHMEKDINLIIDVEPEEAQLLIGLIEQLVEDWYIQKHDREERMKKVKQLAEDKKLKKNL